LASNVLKSSDHEIIGKEEKILVATRNAIQKAAQSKGLNKHRIGEELKKLRDEAAQAKEADLPAIFDQMNSQRAIIEQNIERSLPDIRSPYFARMKLQEGIQSREILLGHKTFLDAPIPIIDWRHAPVSKIFFRYREGEEYQEKLPGRLAEGIIEERHVLTIKDGELIQVTTPNHSYRRNEAKKWSMDARGILPNLAGGQGKAQRMINANPTKIGTGLGGLESPEVSALLDKNQYNILHSTDSEPLLILGSAGCGKTTIALHRIASLLYMNPEKYKENNIIVVVPEEGLLRLSKKLLASLGLHRVQVTTFDAWIRKQGHTIFRDLPRKICHDTPATVIRFKRHPAIRSAFRLLAGKLLTELHREIVKKFPYANDMEGFLKEATVLIDKKPLMKIIDDTEKFHIKLIRKDFTAKEHKARIKLTKDFYRDQRKKALQSHNDRINLFADQDLLKAIVDESKGHLTTSMSMDVFKHSLNQMEDLSIVQYQDIDKSRIETVDGKSILDEESGSLAKTIDSEDFSILLEFHAFKTGKRINKLPYYCHMVVDEAQDLAPAELNILGQTLTDNGSVTISGDAAQQIDSSNTFDSWRQVLAEMGQPEVSPNLLKTTYRSTKPIAEFAHKILGHLAPKEQPIAIKDGLPVTVSTFPNEGHSTVFLTEALNNLMTEEPRCSVAIIARNTGSAKRVFQSLDDLPDIRLVLDGSFSFRPGIDVTEANQVKGLEFDYVIIPDAAAGFYQDKPSDRRLLHVAATRAIHQMWIIANGKVASIIPQANDPI